jgi:drug/metabolite transporter (DMT)-like permease
MTGILLPIVWLFWGLAYPLMSWSLHAADLFSTRMIILPTSGLLLLAIGAIRGAPVLPERRRWGTLALTGFFNMGLFQIFLISGIATLGPSRTPIIVYTMPCWSALFAVFLLGERITLRIALSLVLSLIAVGLIISQEAAARAAPIGTLLTLLSAISFGIGTVLTKRNALRGDGGGDPAVNAGWQLLLGTLPVLVVWLVYLPHAYFRPEETRGLMALGFLIVFSNAVAYFCWFRIIQIFPAAVASLTTLVVPCVGFASSALLIGGNVSWFDVAALGLIVAAVALVLAPSGKSQKGKDQPAKERQ